MLNNPDIQPGAAVNRWIVGIKLFHFELVHVPGTQHNGPDGLSRRMPSPNDPLPVDDSDDWLDRTMSFAVVLMNSAPSWSIRLTLLAARMTELEQMTDQLFSYPRQLIFWRPRLISSLTTRLQAMSLIFPIHHWPNLLMPISRPSATFYPTPCPRPVSLIHSYKSSSVTLQNSSFLMAA